MTVIESKASMRQHSKRLVTGTMFAVLGAIAVSFGIWRSRASGPTEVAPTDSSFTIFLLGSSTGQGYPYFPKCSIGKIARLLVGGEIAGLPVRVVNLAGPGKTARVTLEDSRKLAASKPRGDRSVVLLYPGNNEFTRYDRRPDLRKAERSLFDEPVVSPTESQRIAGKYGDAITATLEVLRAARLDVVVCAAAVNAKDWDPNRSCVSAHADTNRVRALLAASEVAASRGALDEAAANLESLRAMEPHFALAYKRLGDVHLRAGHRARARAAYQSAIDTDGNPLRETSDLEAALRHACVDKQVVVLDCDSVLAAASPDSTLGFEYMLDNCHPNLAGYILLAEAFLKTIREKYRIDTIQTLTPEEVSRTLGLDPPTTQSVYNVVGQYCYVASTLTFDPAPRLRRSRFYLEQAAQLGENADVECSLAVLSALEGDVTESLAHWRTARGIDADVAKTRMANRYVAQVMSRRGIPDLERALR